MHRDGTGDMPLGLRREKAYGFQCGKALGEEEGRKAGRKEGYRRGVSDGRLPGVEEGEERGYARGLEAGFPCKERLTSLESNPLTPAFHWFASHAAGRTTVA
ncbi:MAG: hypothetical protein IPJ40_24375 [Saprospirales bacterium]|nr:hypothetical protein [Saprospirales bacterium]